MDKQSQVAQEPQIVDLGDAKALTQGYWNPLAFEEELQVEGNEKP